VELARIGRTADRRKDPHDQEYHVETFGDVPLRRCNSTPFEGDQARVELPNSSVLRAWAYQALGNIFTTDCELEAQAYMGRSQSSTCSSKLLPPSYQALGYNAVQLMAVAEHAHYGCFGCRLSGARTRGAPVSSLPLRFDRREGKEALLVNRSA